MHAAHCGTTETQQLLFLGKSGEPSGHPNHNITYEHLVVEVCPTCDGATLEKLDHDCWDYEEVWDQYEWYELTPQDGARLRQLASRCDQPLNPSCGCALHRSLRESAQALPSSAWSAVFESETKQHRHRITLTGDATPRFRLVSTDPPPPAEPAAHTSPDPAKSFSDRSTYTAMALAVVLYVGALTLYFRGADLHWLLDAAVVLVLIPVTVLGAIALVAIVEVIRES